MTLNSNIESTDAAWPRIGLTSFHYVVVAASFVLTFVVWLYANQISQQQAAAAFDRAADQILALTQERMRKYEDGLWAGVGALNINHGQITLDDWRQFARTLRIDVKYPGINGIGVILNVDTADMPEFLRAQRRDRPDFRVHPEHRRGEHYPITYIEPEPQNRQAVGLDMAFEANRYTALMASRDTGRSRITGPITLVQDETATPGFLFFAPVYQQGPLDTLADRQRLFAGAVYAPFVVNKLMQGVLAKENRSIWLSISDGDSQIYDEHQGNTEGHDPDPMYQRTVTLDMYGRDWTFDLQTNAAFRQANAHVQPTIILICGLMIDFLLLALFAILGRANHRMHSYAQKVTMELRHEKAELLDSNTALEQFSYVASHDLKTPIRGMRDTVDYLAEDLDSRHPKAAHDPALQPHIATMHRLLDRMEALIKGVLDCARISQVSEEPIEIDPQAELAELAEILRLPDGALTIEGALPPIHVPPTMFRQIFQNLLKNAAKHRADQNDLRIIVSGTVDGNDLFVRVKDNGPGIDARYHDRIFEMFQSLASDAEQSSTGIGLAIVRRAVRALGGSVHVESPDDGGSTFVVHLPECLGHPAMDLAAE